MPSCMTVLLAGSLVLAAVQPQAEPVGNWKVLPLLPGQQVPLMVLRLEKKNDQWSGRVTALAGTTPAGMRLTDITVTGEVVRFRLPLGQQTWHFEGIYSRQGGRRILGSFELPNGQVTAVALEETALASIGPLELALDTLRGTPTDQELFDATLSVFRLADPKKLSMQEVRAFSERALQAARRYGPRWQQEFALQAASALSNRKEYHALSVELAQQAERDVNPQAEAATQVRTLNRVAQVLRKAGQVQQADALQQRIAALERRSYQENIPELPFKPQTYPGRKTKSNRTVLVELFAGAHDPLSPAAMLAFEGLRKTYQPSEVVFLQYHLDRQRSDPLPNPLAVVDGEARQRYYRDAAAELPSILFNGKPEARGGGTEEEAQDKYADYRDVIDHLLEQPAKATIQLKAVRQAGKVEIAATVSDLTRTGDWIRLRFALAEDWVEYRGSNRVRFHGQVVRALPGGTAGRPLTRATSEHTLTVDLNELQAGLEKYLDARQVNEERPRIHSDRLRLVAFVQDDQTREVLQAAQVALTHAASDPSKAP